jgi:hypothetical protein
MLTDFREQLFQVALRYNQTINALEQEQEQGR